MRTKPTGRGAPSTPRLTVTAPASCVNDRARTGEPSIDRSIVVAAVATHVTAVEVGCVGDRHVGGNRQEELAARLGRIQRDVFHQAELLQRDGARFLRAASDLHEGVRHVAAGGERRTGVQGGKRSERSQRGGDDGTTVRRERLSSIKG